MTVGNQLTLASAAAVTAVTMWLAAQYTSRNAVEDPQQKYVKYLDELGPCVRCNGTFLYEDNVTGFHCEQPQYNNNTIFIRDEKALNLGGEDALKILEAKSDICVSYC